MRALLRYCVLLPWFILAGCEHPQTPVPLIRIDGSSTLYPLSEAVAEDFQKSQAKRIHVTVGMSGTGGGLKKFCRGEIEIATASRPIALGERQTCAQAGIRYLELPIAWDAVTVVVHADNAFIDALTVAQLRQLWEPDAQDRLTRWQQLDPRWPDQPIHLYGAGPDSGTFDHFTEVVVGRARASRGDYTASEDDHLLVQGLQSDPQALGYIGHAYFAASATRLRAVPIRVGAGAPAVLPSPGTVHDGSYRPLTRPLLLYVEARAASRPEVRQLLDWWLAHAATLTTEVRLIGLTAEGYRLVAQTLARGRTGTVFDSRHQPGLTLTALLAREVKP